MKHYMRKNRKSVVFFAASNFAAAVSSVFLSYLLGMFAKIALAGAWDHLWLLAAGTLGYIFLDTYLQYLMEYTKASAIHKIGRDLRSDLLRKIEALRYEEKCRQEDGYYLSILNNDVPVIEGEYLDSMGAIYYQICCFCLAILSALSIQPVMTVILVFISILPTLFPKLTEKRLQMAKEEEQQAKASYLGMLTQIFRGFSLLKVFHSFREIDGEYDRENGNLCEKKTRFCRLKAALYAGVFGCGSLVFLGTWVVGLFFVRKDSITLPDLIIFAQLMTFVAGPIQIIGERYASFTAASAVGKRLMAFLKNAPEEEARWGEKPLETIECVRLQDVQVSAGEKVLLRNADLTLRRGDRVAILGESGSGKSTLVRYLAGLTTGAGSYEINGVPVHSYAYPDFREHIALLEQESLLFNGSIRENLTLFSHLRADDAALVRVLDNVGLSKWYEKRGHSLNETIGTEQQRMSGGEARRLNLGRILLKNADMVLLDEPTTGLDAESRTSIEATIQNMQCGILVAIMHEYSPEFLAAFNRVLVVKDGQLYEKALPEAVPE